MIKVIWSGEKGTFRDGGNNQGKEAGTSRQTVLRYAYCDNFSNNVLIHYKHNVLISQSIIH